MEIAAVALLLRNDNFILPKSLFYNNSQLLINPASQAFLPRGSGK